MGAGNEGSGDVGAHDFEDGGLNILISETLDVAVVDCFRVKVLYFSQICRGLDPIE